MGRVGQATRADGAAGEYLFSGWAGGGHLVVRLRPGPAVPGRETHRACGRSGARRDDQREAPPLSCARPVECRIHPGHAGSGIHVPFPIAMNQTDADIGSQLITLLASLMLVMQLLL